MAAFEVPRFWIYGIITLKDLLLLTVKEGTVKQICPEVHLLLRESNLWNTWPDYRLYVKAEPQGYHAQSLSKLSGHV